MTRPLVPCLAALLALLPPVLPAALAGQEGPDHRLEEITVTVTRSEVRLVELPRSVVVLTEVDLARTPATELADLLKAGAGLDVIQFPGLLSGVGVRGFRPELGGVGRRTLLLIDGRPAGATNLATIDPASLERIEVLRGPASALHGASAMGGVVNLVPRRSAGAPGGRVEVGYGSFDTYDLAARAGGGVTDRVEVDLGVRGVERRSGYRVGEGNLFRSLLGDAPALKIRPDGREEPVEQVGDGVVREHARYAHRSGHARVGVDLTPGWRAEVRGEAFRADGVETPGDLASAFPSDGRKDLGRGTAEVALRGKWGGRHRSLARVFGAREEADHYALWADPAFLSFGSALRTVGAQLQNRSRLPRGALTAGLDLTRVTAETRAFSGEGTPAAPFSPHHGMASTAAFAELLLPLLGERLTATAGLRADRVGLELRETPLRPDVRPARETFVALNPSAGINLDLGEGVRIRASAGRGFVAPDAFQRAGLAAPGAGTGATALTVGNPGLAPESSVTVDAGVLLHRSPGVEAELTLFRTVVTNRITAAAAFFREGEEPRRGGDRVMQLLTYVNAAGARMRGMEAGLSYDLGARRGWPWSLRAFVNATRMFRAEELVQAAAVDPDRFASGEEIRPEDVFPAVVFGPEAPARIKNVADLTLIGGVEYGDLERFHLRLSGRYVGERLETDLSDFADVTDILYPPQMTLDLSAGLGFRDRYRATLTVMNVTDENRYEVRGFNLPGREVRLGVGVEL